MKTCLKIIAVLALLSLPLCAQVTQTAQITSNTLNTTANIVTLDTAAVALSVGASTTGTLTCTTYPVITFIVTRNAINSTLGSITTSNAASWTAAPLFTPLLAGDLIFAKLTTSGLGCTNELPLTVSATYSPAAGLCDANPSACVTLTGTIAGANGLTANNLTLTFKPSQMAFLGGVPPAPPSSGGGGTSPGLCEMLGVNPGDICYFSGSAWGILTGNNTGDKFLQEDPSGVPSWQLTPAAAPADYQHNDTSVAAQPALDFEDGGGVTFSLTNDSGNNRVKVSATAASGGVVSFDSNIPLDTTGCDYPGTCSHLHRTDIPWQASNAYMGPLPPTNPQSAWVQDKICTLTSVGEVDCALDNPVLPGDSIYMIGYLQCGIGCSGKTFTYTDDQLDAFIQIDTANGGGFSIPFGSAYSSGIVPGIRTFKFIPSTPGANYNTQVHIIELRGAVTVDVHSSSTDLTYFPLVFLPVTTTNAPEAIIATAFGNDLTSVYSAGTGYAMLSQSNVASYASMGSEITNKLTTGTYTPTMTTTGDGVQGVIVATFVIVAPGSTAIPFPRPIRYVDLTASGDFPDLVGNDGALLCGASGVVGLCSPSGSGTVNSGTATHLAYYATSTTAVSDMGTDFTFASHTLTMNANGLLNLSGGTSFKPPGGGATLTLGTTNQNWATLGTGIVKNTTTTGALSDAANTDVTGLFSCGTKGYLFGGSGGSGCDTPAGTTYSGTSNQIGVSGSTISLDPQFTVNSYGTCTNTADALTMTPADAPTALADGLTVTCLSSAANTTTTPTLKVGSLAAKTIVKAGTSGQAALVANDILTNMVATFKYNATATTWELQNPQQPAGSGITSITGPSDLSTWTVVGTSATQGKANAPTDTVWSGPPAAGLLTPVVRQVSLPCATPAGGLVGTCSFPSATQAGDLIFVATIANSYTGYGCVSGVQGNITALTISDGTNSYNTIDTHTDTSSHYEESAYAANIAGGAVTVTVTATAPGGTSACFSTMLTEIANVATVSPLDVHGKNTTIFATLTTTTANDIILGAAWEYGASATFTALPGWPLVIPSDYNSGTGMARVEVATIGAVAGVYTPLVTDSSNCGIVCYRFDASFKAATAGGGSQPWSANPISQEMMTQAVWPNLAGIVPAGTATGDTGMSQHVGSHILSTDRTTAYAGNDSASTLYLTTLASGYTCHVYIKCNTSVSTATVVPSLIYTSDDSASTVETIAGSTALCTSLGTSDVASMTQEIHAKTGTTIYLETTLANSPHYNTDAFCELHTTQ